MRNSLLREMICGLLLGILIMPPLPAHAQIFGPLPVTDYGAYAQRIDAKLEKAREWIEKVQQWETTINKYEQQLTTMNGILGIADKELARNLALAKLTVDMANIIQSSHQLYGMSRNMVVYQIQSLQNMRTRLDNGIFNPEQDLQDFENYLLYSMGRNSQQTIQMAVRTAQADAQVGEWMDLKTSLEVKLAENSKTFRDLSARLIVATANPQSDPANVQALNISMAQTIKKIDDLTKEIADLNDKIQQRISAMGLTLSDMENFGFTVESAKGAWRETVNTKAQMSSAIDATISGMQINQ